MQLQLKLQKRAETTYLDANKQQTTYRLIYLEVSKQKKKGTIDALKAKRQHET